MSFINLDHVIIKTSSATLATASGRRPAGAFQHTHVLTNAHTLRAGAAGTLPVDSPCQHTRVWPNRQTLRRSACQLRWQGAANRQWDTQSCLYIKIDRFTKPLYFLIDIFPFLDKGESCGWVSYECRPF